MVVDAAPAARPARASAGFAVVCAGRSRGARSAPPRRPGSLYEVPGELDARVPQARGDRAAPPPRGAGEHRAAPAARGAAVRSGTSSIVWVEPAQRRETSRRRPGRGSPPEHPDVATRPPGRPGGPRGAVRARAAGRWGPAPTTRTAPAGRSLGPAVAGGMELQESGFGAACAATSGIRGRSQSPVASTTLARIPRRRGRPLRGSRPRHPGPRGRTVLTLQDRRPRNDRA